MENETLNSSIDRYEELQEMIDRFTAEKEELKTAIIKGLDEQGITYFKTELGNTAKVVSKTTIKYTDELAMLNWCKRHGYANLIQEKLNTTEMNKQLRSSLSLTESLSPYFQETTSVSLTVKGV